MARSYHQFCGLARALDRIGERWTLLIVRNLLLGPMRYSDLLRGLPGITTNLLAARLRTMEETGILERIRQAPAEGGHAYRLTPLGLGLEPAIHALGAWGWNWMQKPHRGDVRSFEWLLVALRRRYPGGVEMTAEIVADDVPYRFDLKDSGIEIGRGQAAGAALRVRGSGALLAAVFLEGLSGSASIPPGLEVSDAKAFGRLVRAFRRGDPATV